MSKIDDYSPFMKCYSEKWKLKTDFEIDARVCKIFNAPGLSNVPETWMAFMAAMTDTNTGVEEEAVFEIRWKGASMCVYKDFALFMDSTILPYKDTGIYSHKNKDDMDRLRSYLLLVSK